MRPATHVFAAAATLLLALTPSLANAAPRPKADDPPAASGPAAPAGDPTTLDMRCIVVAGALLGADDEQLKSVGRASLFYYLGRLQGRGDTANMDARVVGEAAKMTSDDIKEQSKTCGAQFTEATQALQSLSDAFQKHFGASPGGAAGGGAAPK